MPFSPDTIFLDPNLIQVSRSTRQRKELDVSDLKPSILKHGVMNPIILRQEKDIHDLGKIPTYFLIAGERRLEACKQLNLEIPCRLVTNLSPNELLVLEFEENHKRKSLPWRQEVQAIGDIHKSYLKSEISWSQSQTANILSIPEPKLSQILNVYNHLDTPILLHAENLSQAISLLDRFLKTKQSVISSEIKSLMHPPTSITGLNPNPPPFLNINLDKEEEPNNISPILNLDFTKWILDYQGPKFNFIHCDFPQSDENFWPITNSFFKNLPKLLAERTHILFWLKLDHLYEILNYILEYKSLGYLTQPLIWYKSDTKPNQILGDPPQHTYETCLIINYNSRSYLSPIQNIYSTPRASQPICPNQKSQSMLKYFFKAFVDEQTNLFDPTAGSGSALLAAEELNCKSVFGLELDPSRCEKANQKIFRQREIEKLTRR